MKRWLYPLAALAAVAVLSRLPHPARDIGMLEPVRTIYLYMEGETLHMETDTGDSGVGLTLTGAAKNMRSKADAEIFLETAEYLILTPDVPITEDFYTLLRPSCYVCFTESPPDLTTAADYLSIHTPKLTLARLRAESFASVGRGHALADQSG